MHTITAPNIREFEDRHSHPVPDPTRNTTDKVYTFWISEMLPISSNLYHEGSNLKSLNSLLSGDASQTRGLETQEIRTQAVAQ